MRLSRLIKISNLDLKEIVDYLHTLGFDYIEYNVNQKITEEQLEKVIRFFQLPIEIPSPKTIETEDIIMTNNYWTILFDRQASRYLIKFHNGKTLSLPTYGQPVDKDENKDYYSFNWLIANDRFNMPFSSVQKNGFPIDTFWSVNINGFQKVGFMVPKSNSTIHIIQQVHNSGSVIYEKKVLDNEMNIAKRSLEFYSNGEYKEIAELEKNSNYEVDINNGQFSILFDSGKTIHYIIYDKNRCVKEKYDIFNVLKWRRLVTEIGQLQYLSNYILIEKNNYNSLVSLKIC